MFSCSNGEKEMRMSSENKVDRSLTFDQITQFKNVFDTSETSSLMQNVVTQRDVNEVALNRGIVTESVHSFSNLLDDWSVTNQARSGRCWMFAGLNMFRVESKDVLNVKEFEFSQNYLMFWDKIERANFLLEAIIDTADKPIDDRTVSWLLQRGVEDGGQWDMFVSLVKKHGVVPKSVMPETESSSNSMRMNSMLNYQYRQGAKKIRDLYAQESGVDDMRESKKDTLSAMYQILAIHLGSPPDQFFWQWRDKDGDFQRDGDMTPMEFAEKYIVTPMDDYVCLVHDPRKSNPYGKTFTIQYLGNVVDGPPIKYINVSIDVMKDIACRMIQDGKPVWMGCDTGKQMHRDLGIWDAELFDYPGVYETEFSMDKSERLEYHQTRMTHAMLFTGVDLVDGKPRRWRVENSWNDKVGDKGFCLMNDSWFAEYMFEISAPKSYLPKDILDAWDDEPIILPPWDPMGSLAE